MDTAVAEQTVTEQIPQTEAQEPEAPASIADHAAQFDGSAQREEREDQQADDLKPIRPVDRQNREQGKFAPGQQRLKAKDAVGRINELTARAKTAEEKLAAAEAELATLRQAGASRAQVAAAETKVETAQARVDAQPAPSSQQAKPQTGEFPEPEPKEDDAKYENDYAKYLRDAARWEARKAHWEANREAEQRAAAAKQGQVWDTRIGAARKKYSDFDAVAARTLRVIPEGSVVSQWILDDNLGEDVLYHYGTHPQELDALLRMSTAHEQYRALSLLSQRFASTQTDTPGQAGTTGSAAGRTIPVLPKPPNPVRTEAQRASDAPPPTDGSLSIAEHGRTFGPRANR